MPHYYSQKQESKPVLKPIKVTLRSISLTLYTSTGVFSKKGLDNGTSLLIESMIIQTGWKILDLGCGYGAIGLFAAKLSKTKPYLVDINERACKIADINARKNGIEAFILQGNIYEPVKDETFDTILLNPPQTAGKDICIAMIRQAKKHLNQNGLLQMVARPNKGGKSLANVMQEAFGNLTIIARRSGYAIYVSKNL